MYIIIFCSLFSYVLNFKILPLFPRDFYYDKRESVLVSCNATHLQVPPKLVYKYFGVEVTLPKVNNDTFVYVGNLTLTNPLQRKANVVCLNSLNDTYLGSRLYQFGYPPAYILRNEFTPKLTCRDYNLQRIVCCLSPNMEEVLDKTLLPFSEFRIYDHSSHKDLKPLNNSCYNATTEILTFGLNYTLFARNILGNFSYDYHFNRYELCQPEKPLLLLKTVNETSIQLRLTMNDFGEYMISINCISEIPDRINKTHEITLIGNNEDEISTGWIPYSKVSCEARSKILFTPSVVHLSEPSFSVLRLPEGIPNGGPKISPAFMNYSFLSSSNYLENVFLYFSDLALRDKNGIITEYKWMCSDCVLYGKDVSNTIISIANTVTHIMIDSAKVNSSFSMAACTKIGCSINWSEIQLKTLKKPKEYSRVYLSQNNNNVVTVFWYLNDETVTDIMNQTHVAISPYIFLCVTSFTLQQCTSTRLVETNNLLTGNKSITIGDFSTIKYAFIPSLDGPNISQLKWIDCVYQLLSGLEIEKKLKGLDYQPFFVPTLSCNLFNCKSTITIKIPSCVHLPFVIFDGISVAYASGKKSINLKKQFLSGNEVEFLLTDLFPAENYQLSIYVITSNNETVFWFNDNLKTNWLNIWYLCAIIIGSIILIIFLICGIRLIYVKSARAYFKKTFPRAVFRVSMKEVSVKPLNLNNTDIKDHYDSIPDYDRSHSSSPIINSKPESKHNGSTNFTNSSYDFTGNSQDTGITISGSYMKRPDLEKYMHLVVPDNKGTLERINHFSNVASEAC